jgi:hypothetical protein
MIAIRDEIVRSPALRDFHNGASQELPAYYHHAFEQKLGRYAALVTRSDRIPSWDAPAAAPALPIAAAAAGAS